MRLAIGGLHHTAFCVTDLERARGFYEGVLGLKRIERPDFPFGGAWYELADGRQLHLIVHERPLTLRGTREIDARDGHIALRITDYTAALAHLRAHGVECLERPDNVTPWKQLYVTDPDGNVIELNVER
jgi:catechol 2,3-dioxygenase-like lactoylglutathione lyase family enzyme